MKSVWLKLVVAGVCAATGPNLFAQISTNEVLINPLDVTEATTRVVEDFSDPSYLSSEDLSQCGYQDGVLGGGGKQSKKISTAILKSHKNPFYNNDFSYINDPCYNGFWFGDGLKQRKFKGIKYDIGGQYRARFHKENNHRGPSLTGASDEFTLHRTRLYLDAQLTSNVRFYGEYIDAVSFGESQAPLGIDENRSDILNAFLDVDLIKSCDEKLTVRAGRQELLYGTQRGISPLDWANTRRTFDGVKVMWQGKNWDVDAFWMRPLTRNKVRVDRPDQDQQFYGVYSSYKGLSKKEKLDAYWMTLEKSGAGGFRFHNLGSRYYVEAGQWMLDAEASFQFGTNVDGSSHDASAFTFGVGRKFDHKWKPELWAYYDFASGDDSLGAGNGYHHMFPLAHKYLGFMDLYGRRNVESPNVRLTIKPTKKLTLMIWYYYMMLENGNDSPYGVTMASINSGVTPGSSDLGHEIDLIAKYQINERANLLFGYSKFYSGKYYDTAGVAYGGDADFFYTQFTFNF